MPQAPSKLEKSLEKLFPGIEFLSVSDSSIIPGIVMDKLRPARKQGHIKSIIKRQTSDYWATDRVKGNILAGDTLTGSSDFSGSLSILSFLKIKASVKTQYSIKYEIDAIQAMNFLNTSKLDLMPLLRQVKNSDKETWQSIKSYYIVTETYYSTSFAITLLKNGNIATEAEFNNDFENISGSVDYSFNQGGKIIVANNSDVPFGFNAFQIKDV